MLLSLPITTKPLLSQSSISPVHVNNIATQLFRLKQGRAAVFRYDDQLTIRKLYKRIRAPLSIEQSIASKHSRSSSNRLICIFRASVCWNGLYCNPACQADSDPTPETSKWPYPTPHPRGYLWPCARFSNSLFCIILG
jgi:hypothetical protein